ncbi:MAG: glycosyltransferase [Candidatus Bathyarchaeia archaeon]
MRRVDKPIVIITSPSLNLLGGAQRTCLCTIAALRKRGRKTVLATVDKTDWELIKKVFGSISLPDEEVYLFSNIPKFSILMLKQFFLAFSYALQLFLIRKNNATSLIVNMGGELVDTIGDVVYVNAVPVRFLHLLRSKNRRFVNRWIFYSKLYSIFLKVLGDSANVIVANSKFTQKIVEEFMGKKAVVINPPVNLSELNCYKDHTRQENIVITISRFRSEKGLKIIPEIASYVKDCKFVIVGIADKESKVCLKELLEEMRRLDVAERVYIYINKPQKSVQKVLRAAKVFLHTQATEAFGISIVEAMAQGCVPIVPRMGGPWIDILDGEDGLYGFSYTRPIEAAEKIERLLLNERLRVEVAERAKQRAMIFSETLFSNKIRELVN